MTGTGPGAGPDGTTRVFISYRHDDTAGYAGWIKTAIEQRLGDTTEIFIDIDDIPPGTDFVHHIQQEVGRCHVMLALIGPAWLIAEKADGSRRLDDPHDFIRLELESAISHGTKVIPVLLHGAKMPELGDVPASIEAVTYKQAQEVSEKRFDYDVDRLVENIAPRRPVPVVEPARPGLRMPPRRVLAGAGFAVIVALGVAIYLATRGGSTFPNSAEKTLLSRAAVSTRDCTHAPSAGRQPAGQVAAVSCSGTVGGPDSVIYALFNSGSDLERAFAAEVHSAKVTQDNGNDCLDVRSAAFAYSSSNTSGGSVLCYIQGGKAYIAWTDDDARVLATAKRTDMRDKTLYAWWSAKVSRSGVPSSQDLSLLKGHVQASHQNACVFYNRGPSFGTQFAINCSNTQYGIDYFQFSTTAAMNAEYTKLLNLSNPPPRTGASGGLECPSQGNVTNGDGVTTGQAFCAINSQTQHPFVWWTDDQLDILSWVGANTTDKTALSDYWTNTGDVFPVGTP